MAKPWMTSDDLVASVKRKISLPTSQSTFTEQDILSFANEEMQISQVPSVMTYHEEYFVYAVRVPLESNVTRYGIPDRAIGMKMRNVMFEDVSGNLNEMTRISPDDKAYWQSSTGTFNSIFRFYIEGNDIVLSPDNTGDTGNLVFYIYLRPNQLVLNTRAATCQFFVKTITCSNIVADDTITIGSTTLTAVSGSPGALQFQLGASDILTATNLTTAINNNSLGIATNGSPATNIVTFKYRSLSTEITTSNSSTIVIQTTQGIEFDNLATTWTDPDTDETSDLFVDGAEIDFLQLKPGHKTYSYDVMLDGDAISGNIVNFDADVVPTKFSVGDYICLANECIIPQIPPDLHNGLAERTGARLLASIGDQAGLQASMVKIQEIDANQGTLLDNRSEGTPQKVSGRKGLLRYQKRGTSWRV